MKGSYCIKVRNRRIAYELNIERNITIIKGNSGTGKTQLISMISSYLNKGQSSGVHIDTNIQSFDVLEGKTDWRLVLENKTNTIYFVDEQVEYVLTKEFYNLLCSTGSYLVYISRSGKTGYLQYAITSVLEFDVVKSGTYYTNIAFSLYNMEDIHFKPDLVLTEDSTSGLDILKHGLLVKVESSKGKDNMVSKLCEVCNYYTNIYIIVDGSAFGNQIGFLFSVIHALPSCNILVFAPESFEYLILNTTKFKRYCKDELENTADYVDPSEYKTWETFFEDLLKRLCINYNYVTYEKKSWDKLNPFFKNVSLVREITSQLVDIDSSLKIQ